MIGIPGRGVAAGGAVGQVLVKTGVGNYVTGWANLSGIGVTSFNGRLGAVMPEAGDYAIGDITGAGTMAGQNANAVNISGGGVDLDADAFFFRTGLNAGWFWAGTGFTGTREVLFSTNDANRVFVLGGNLSVSAAADVSGTNTGDQTSIVGISGTMAQFNTACSNGDFAFGGGTCTGTCSGVNTGDQTSIVGITGTMAQFNTACSNGDFAFGGGTCTGTSSGVNTGDQTSIVGITGTIAQFNTACTDADFATGGGVITGTSSGANTGDQTSIVGISGTKAQFDTACSDGNFAYASDFAAKVSDTLASASANPSLVHVQIAITDPNGDALTTGNGKAYMRIPAKLNGMNLVAVAMAVIAPGSTSGNPSFQVTRIRAGASASVLTTVVSVDANQVDSSTATTPAVIGAANDDVATADQYRFDCTVAGTAVHGVMFDLTWQLP